MSWKPVVCPAMRSKPLFPSFNFPLLRIGKEGGRKEFGYNFIMVHCARFFFSSIFFVGFVVEKIK